MTSRVSLPVMLWMLLRTGTTMTPAAMLRGFTLFFALPGAAAWLLARACAARVLVRDDAVIIVGRTVQIEAPMSAIAAVVPWRLPLPGAGFALALTSGRLRYAIAAVDPTPLLHALALQGVGGAAAAVERPSVVYAHARAELGRWRWRDFAARYPLFALLPALPLFNVHQHIAYGGFFGEYYLYGAAAWWGTFGLYWSLVTVYLVLYAAVWRGLAELACAVTATVAPSSAARVRRAAEWIVRLGYYGGVPVMLALRFAPW